VAIWQEVLKRRPTQDATFNQALANLNTDRPSIHIGALQELDKLAQDHPQYRQRVVNLICGYLSDTSAAIGLGRTQASGWHVARDTCQSILAAHLRPPEEPDGNRGSQRGAFWEDIDLRLMGATLHNLDLSGCRVRNAWFNGAVFIGETRFRGAEFYGPAVFENATFRHDVEFMETTFANHAWFTNATFSGSAMFGSIYASGRIFAAATFYGNAWFRDASFERAALFSGVQFSSRWHAAFESAKFHGSAWFHGASMVDGLFFGAQFGDSTGFTHVKFEKLWFRSAVFRGETQFNEISSGQYVYLHSASLQANADQLARCVLPPDWRLRAAATPGTYTFISAWPDDQNFIGVLMDAPPRP